MSAQVRSKKRVSAHVCEHQKQSSSGTASESQQGRLVIKMACSASPISYELPSTKNPHVLPHDGIQLHDERRAKLSEEVSQLRPAKDHASVLEAFRHAAFAIVQRELYTAEESYNDDYFTRIQKIRQLHDKGQALAPVFQKAMVAGLGIITLLEDEESFLPPVFSVLKRIYENELYSGVNEECSIEKIMKQVKRDSTLNVFFCDSGSISTSSVSPSIQESPEWYSHVKKGKVALEQVRQVLYSFILDPEATIVLGKLINCFAGYLTKLEMKSVLREVKALSVAPYLLSESKAFTEYLEKKYSSQPSDLQNLKNMLSKRDGPLFHAKEEYKGVLFVCLNWITFSEQKKQRQTKSSHQMFPTGNVLRKLALPMERFNAHTSESKYTVHLRVSDSSNRATSDVFKRRAHCGAQVGGKFYWSSKFCVLLPEREKNPMLQISLYESTQLPPKCVGKISDESYSTIMQRRDFPMLYKRGGGQIRGKSMNVTTQLFAFKNVIHFESLEHYYAIVALVLLEEGPFRKFKKDPVDRSDKSVLACDSVQILKYFKARFPFSSGDSALIRLELYILILEKVISVSILDVILYLVSALELQKESLSESQTARMVRDMKILQHMVAHLISYNFLLALDSSHLEIIFSIFSKLSGKNSQAKINKLLKNCASLFLIGKDFHVAKRAIKDGALKITVREFKDVLLRSESLLKKQYPSNFCEVNGEVVFTLLTRLAPEEKDGESCAIRVDAFRHLSSLIREIHDESVNGKKKEYSFGKVFASSLNNWIKDCSVRYRKWAEIIIKTIRYNATTCGISNLTEVIYDSIPSCFTFLNSFVWKSSFKSAASAYHIMSDVIYNVLCEHHSFVIAKLQKLLLGFSTGKKQNIFAFSVVLNSASSAKKSSIIEDFDEIGKHHWKKLQLCFSDLCFAYDSNIKIKANGDELLSEIFFDQLKRKKLTDAEMVACKNEFMDVSEKIFAKFVTLLSLKKMSECIELLIRNVKQEFCMHLAAAVGARLDTEDGEKESSILSFGKAKSKYASSVKLLGKKSLQKELFCDPECGKHLAVYIATVVGTLSKSATVSAVVTKELLRRLWNVTVECFEGYLLPAPSPLLSISQLKLIQGIVQDFISFSVLNPPAATKSARVNSDEYLDRLQHCVRLCVLGSVSTGELIESLSPTDLGQLAESSVGASDSACDIMAVLKARSRTDKRAKKLIKSLKRQN